MDESFRQEILDVLGDTPPQGLTANEIAHRLKVDAGLVLNGLFDLLSQHRIESRQHGSPFPGETGSHADSKLGKGMPRSQFYRVAPKG